MGTFSKKRITFLLNFANFHLNYLFQAFSRPTSISAINTAEGKKGHCYF